MKARREHDQRTEVLSKRGEVKNVDNFKSF